MLLATVATCSYILLMISTGIRELKNNLSHYVRQIEAGKRIAVTAHGRVVAELVPHRRGAGGRRYDALVAAGVIEPAVDSPLAPWPHIHAPSGTASQLIDSDRGE
jgi:prevent-host-death family protein